MVPEGRISPQDAGIWNDEQAADYRRITDFVRGQGAVPGIQLAHAGRKASTRAPLARARLRPGRRGRLADGRRRPARVRRLAGAARADRRGAGRACRVPGPTPPRRSLAAGFEVAEIHAAHGYLLHQFLSPLTNRRTDAWGGDLAGRSRLLLDVVDAVREVWPDDRPVFVRVSATDWVEGGLDLDETAEVARAARRARRRPGRRLERRQLARPADHRSSRATRCRSRRGSERRPGCRWRRSA